MGQTNTAGFFLKGAHALVNIVGSFTGVVNMYELHQRAETEMRPAKTQNTFQIQNMQMRWFLLNSGVCITSVDTGYESCSVLLVYRLQNTMSFGIFYFKRH